MTDWDAGHKLDSTGLALIGSCEYGKKCNVLKSFNTDMSY